MLQPMLIYLLNEGGFENVPLSWPELAEQFGVGEWPAETQEQRKKNGDAARNQWRRLEKRIKSLELRGYTLDKSGNVVSAKFGQKTQPENAVDVLEKSGAKIVGGTVNPYGGAWLKYSNVAAYGLDIETAAQASEILQGRKFEPPERPYSSGIGVVDFSDLHTGGVLRQAVETVKTLPYDAEILTGYMDQAVQIVNEYQFRELYVMLPGDLVETFTAFNHRDTWRHIQANQGGIVILAYEIIRRTLLNLNNVKRVYMVEGNHDRMTSAKEGNSRKGVVELIAYFLAENSGLDIIYHPWLTADEIDGCWHMMTHGDHRPFAKNDFWFRYGKQGRYNILRTGHFHGFNILRQTNDNLHYQCPSIFPGNFFSESLGFDSVPAITICQHENGIPRLDYRPLGNLSKESGQ